MLKKKISPSFLSLRLFFIFYFQLFLRNIHHSSFTLHPFSFPTFFSLLQSFALPSISV